MGIGNSCSSLSFKASINRKGLCSHVSSSSSSSSSFPALVEKAGDSSWSRACSFSSSSSRTSLASKNTSSSSSSSRGAESRLQKQQHVLPLVGADRIQRAKGTLDPAPKRVVSFLRRTFRRRKERERERERDGESR